MLQGPGGEARWSQVGMGRDGRCALQQVDEGRRDGREAERKGHEGGGSCPDSAGPSAALPLCLVLGLAQGWRGWWAACSWQRFCQHRWSPSGRQSKRRPTPPPPHPPSTPIQGLPRGEKTCTALGLTIGGGVRKDLLWENGERWGWNGQALPSPSFGYLVGKWENTSS